MPNLTMKELELRVSGSFFLKPEGCSALPFPQARFCEYGTNGDIHFASPCAISCRHVCFLTKADVRSTIRIWLTPVYFSIARIRHVLAGVATDHRILNSHHMLAW